MATIVEREAGEALEGLPERLADALEGYVGRLDVELLRRAYAYSKEAHAGQSRVSGEDFVHHCVEVAAILAEIRLDTASIAAALVHDTVEDTGATLGDLERRFGGEVAAIVDGVTKIGRVRFRSHAEHQVENYRKLLLSMADDVRVILVKLADRLHNMRTLEALPGEKRRRIALETREIYAPLAHRLGMAAIKWELEDLAFKALEPAPYEALVKKVKQNREERERQILELQEPLEEELREHGIPFEVYGRPKHLWSIYKKMKKREKPYEEIYDLQAVRIITDSVQSCYAALGIIHNRWTPIQERFHDYIATPKSNMYRSLHTTIFGPGGRRYEIQIRTREMHRTAEYGIAAHWRYKEGRETKDSSEVDEALTWFRQVLEWQQDTREPEEFMEFLKIDLFQEEIFVFTPMGDVKQLPAGATPIDFAFAVHTEIGFHCAGAKVNGRIAPLSRTLENGDTVEILTNQSQKPSRDWLAFVKTARARQKIRQWIRKEEFDSSVQLGEDFLRRHLRKLRMELPGEEERARAARELDFEDFDHVHAALGRGDIGPTAVIRALYPDEEPGERRDRRSTLSKLADKLRRSDRGVRIQGLDNMMVKYAQCCQPVPGDDVIGYITRGRGVSIHRKDCPNVLQLSEHPERRIEIEWTAEKEDRFLVRILTKGTDRRGLLSDIASAISDSGTNIQQADIDTVHGGMNGEFVVEVRDLGHLEKVMKGIRRVKGVTSVVRRESFAESDLTEA